MFYLKKNNDKGVVMSYKEIMQQWLDEPGLDTELKAELQSLTDEKDKEDRFYKDLSFGTGGLRGKIGVGTNRVNIYTIARATAGFADYLIGQSEENKSLGAVIAYDSRNKSQIFAKTTAQVMAAKGMKVYLYHELRPTPQLSYSVRELKAAGGVVVTASHNPKEYNGYKIYDKNGCQCLPDEANEVIDRINAIDNYFSVEMADYNEAVEQGMIVLLDEKIDNQYLDAVASIMNPEVVNKDYKIVYTPLNGSGNIPVQNILKKLGYENIYVVKEQEMPDGNFSSLDKPNPEEAAAFTLAMKLGEKIGADLLLGTDPDCDRVGAVVRNGNGQYQVLTGNQTGALLVDYFIKTRKDQLENNGVVVKTIVTSDLGGKIAENYGYSTMDTLTGFKFIGALIEEFEQSGDYTYIFGYEESYGYLAGTFVRDKDAVMSTALICEMACYYDKQGKTLLDAMNDIYSEYGVHREYLDSIQLEGKEGQEKIVRIMSAFRENYFKDFGEQKLLEMQDYLSRTLQNFEDGTTSEITLPVSNVLKFRFDDGTWFALRPSGTEPKLKIYMGIVADNDQIIEEKRNNCLYKIMEIINSVE
jgi:phosphoglucomutase